MTAASRRGLGIGLAIAVLALDQASKWWIVHHIMAAPKVIQVTSFFNLVLGYNRGVSFGMFGSGEEFGRWALVALALAIVTALTVWLVRAEKPLLAAALGMIIGGAVGNVLDRARLGGVVDFLDFHAFGYHWPAFNVADTGITVGAALLIFDSIFGDHDGPAEDKKG
jgi:signal peptidase II